MLNKKSILGRRQHLCEIVVFWTVVICGFMCKPFPYLEKLQNQYFHHSTPHGSPLSFLNGRILGNCSTQCRPGRMMPCSNLFASRSNRSAWPLAPSTATPLAGGWESSSPSPNSPTQLQNDFKATRQFCHHLTWCKLRPGERATNISCTCAPS